MSSSSSSPDPHSPFTVILRSSSSPSHSSLLHVIGSLAGPIDPKTKKPAGRPFKFRIHSGQVVKGWDEGVSQLSLGEKARITMTAGGVELEVLTVLMELPQTTHMESEGSRG
mmetsp:Transcript_754/g.2254  ORF Transcript_754/g.2254 Transcript_754/m.2254 type:complete len:112 (-) Transcript_754:121-456(-)